MEIVKKIEMHFQEWFKEMRRAILEVNSHVAPEDRELSLTELFRKYRESIPLETFRLDAFTTLKKTTMPITATKKIS